MAEVSLDRAHSCLESKMTKAALMQPCGESMAAESEVAIEEWIGRVGPPCLPYYAGTLMTPFPRPLGRCF